MDHLWLLLNHSKFKQYLASLAQLLYPKLSVAHAGNLLQWQAKIHVLIYNSLQAISKIISQYKPITAAENLESSLVVPNGQHVAL